MREKELGAIGVEQLTAPVTCSSHEVGDRPSATRCRAFGSEFRIVGPSEEEV